MKPSRHISLVGLSGTGKSSVAPIVAERTGREVADIDAMVEKTSGRTVQAIFSEDGEQRFRELETAELRVALGVRPTVIATGGGIVTAAESATLLGAQSTVVWLRADPSVLLDRLRNDAEPRPLLEGDPASQLESMARRRYPAYESLADVVVDVDDLALADVADRVAESVGVPS
ncbi:MAG: shikimate kinase [Microthrixaceae bacterium]